MNIRDRLKAYFKAGYSGLYLESWEEARVELELAEIAKDIGFELWTWSCTGSLQGPIKFSKAGSQAPVSAHYGEDKQPLNPLQLLTNMNELLDPKSIVLAKDFHLFLEEKDPVIIRAVKDCLEQARVQNRHLVVMGCRHGLVKELEKEFTLVEFSLPDRDTLNLVLKGISKSAKLELNGSVDEILDAAAGMTTVEASDAFALAVVESGGESITPAVVHREKSNAVKKNGLLEIVPVTESINDVGGNAGIKEWIRKRKHAFSKDAQKFGLPVPRGVLLVGIPGAGKTQFGRIVASVLGVPLIKLDAGKLFGSLVGQSEANLREVIATAEAIAPCVLLVDEIEKGLSGSKSSGSTDGGTSARVFGTFLQWMNDKKAPVFVVATANDISQLPPEFLRKGRFDELFFVDLPTMEEREEIFRIHLTKRNRNPDDFDLNILSSETKDFTGAEIEAVVVEGLYGAFDASHELSNTDMHEAIKATIPLSKTMASQVQGLKDWAEGRARRASKKAEAPHRGSERAIVV